MPTKNRQGLHNSLSAPLRMPRDASTLQFTSKALDAASDEVRTLLGRFSEHLHYFDQLGSLNIETSPLQPASHY